MRKAMVLTLGLACLFIVFIWGGDGWAREQFLESGRSAQRAGHLNEALWGYAAAAEQAKRAGDSEAEAVALSALGAAQLQAGNPDAAFSSLDRSLRLARASANRVAEAAALGNIGNLMLANNHLPAARKNQEEAYALARREGLPAVAARAALNAAVIAARDHKPAAAVTWLQRALEHCQTLPASPEQSFLMVSIAQLMLTAGADRVMVAQLLAAARTLAAEVGDRRSQSFAEGLLGRAAELAGDHRAALLPTRRAIFVAQSADAPDSLYQWQWQLARLLAATGDAASAMAAYRDAIATLQAVRLDMPQVDPLSGRPVFRERVGPVFLGLTELLLRQAAAEPAQRQQYLRAARDVVEQFKAAELEDYFREACLPVGEQTDLDTLAADAAVLYPILFPDRIELLLSTSAQIIHHTVRVDANRLRDEIAALRRDLETYNVDIDVQPSLARLYDWLLRPLEEDLRAHVLTTLVYVPDDMLRSIPLAALYDGRQYVAERFAVATVPGVRLLEPMPLQSRPMASLVVGLSVQVEDFVPLPGVVEETKAVHGAIGGQLLLDEAFRVDSMHRLMTRSAFSIVHLASHAVFANDPKQSFILTYDGKISLDELRDLVGRSAGTSGPLEMLTLSACETAAGDDRAALGLAGVAIKAGARSVVASLWPIADDAAARLLPEFYAQLRQPGASKASALQAAQVSLMRTPAFRHPSFWAPFLVVGNWL